MRGPYGPHDEQTKAAALAALATGTPLAQVSRELGISRPTLTAWRDAAGLAPALQQKAEADLGEQLYGYLQGAISALTAQLAVFADPAWLRTQSAADLAILHGVINDKTARLLAAIRPDGDEDAPADVLDIPPPE